MSTFKVIIPALDQARTRRLLRSMKFAHRRDIILVDNSPLGLNVSPYTPSMVVSHGHNIGIAASWNYGVEWVLYAKADYLVIVSTSVEFTGTGGRLWAAHLGDDPRGLEANDLGWHLVAIGRPILEKIGSFDERFFAYYEENDFLRRMLLAGLRTEDEGVGPHVWADARLEGTALHFDAPGVAYGVAGKTYRRKWGGLPGHETLTTPRWETP